MQTESDLRVLVVDDDPILCDIMTHLLSSIGVGSVTSADDGERALARLDTEAQPFDVVFCDLNMPGMDGIEFLRHLGERAVSAQLVLLSGEDERVIKTAAELADVHGLKLLDALKKPVSQDAVREVVEKALERNRSEAGAGAGACTPAESVSRQELLKGLDDGMLTAFFQPKISIATKELVGVESLVRWRMPDNTIRGPGSFVPLAESSGLIGQLTEAVFAKAMKWGGRWKREGLEIHVAVNASVESLTNVAFVDFVTDQAASGGLDPSQVVIEVTETRLMADVAAALEILSRLRLKGIGLAIDDFGTGYSSLQQLKRIPFTELKIDRAFVDGASQDPDARAMLESSVDLARKLHLSLVAEGVETTEDFDLLATLGVDTAQGYLVAKPMPGKDIMPWCESWRAAQ